MPSDAFAFRGPVAITLVREGADVLLPYNERTRFAVFGEMLVQICRDYSSLPNIRKMATYEIEFFYDALRYELKKATKP